MAAGRGNSPFPWTVHPIWRGIGCGFLILVPLISYGLGDMLLSILEEPLPGPLAETVVLPLIGEVEALWGRVFITGVLSIVLLMLLAILGSFLYSLLGGKRQEDEAAKLKRDKYKY